MPTYRFTMTCGHVREVESDQAPSSRTPHCYECRAATGKKVQKPMQSLEVKDGKKWTAIEIPEFAPRGEGRKGKGGGKKRASRAERVPTVVAAMEEARALKAAKKNGGPLPETPNLDAVNAAHGISTVNGISTETTTDEAVSAETTVEAPAKVTRKSATKQASKKAPAKKAAAAKTPSAKRNVTPIPKGSTSKPRKATAKTA
jgi:hypothetical protein